MGVQLLLTDEKDLNAFSFARWILQMDPSQYVIICSQQNNSHTSELLLIVSNNSEKFSGFSLLQDYISSVTAPLKMRWVSSLAARLAMQPHPSNEVVYIVETCLFLRKDCISIPVVSFFYGTTDLSW